MTYFSHISGNEPIKGYLTRMVQKKVIAQSLLFSGPEGAGKSQFAVAFAKLLICQNDPDGQHFRKIDAGIHPDIRIYHPEGKIGMHSIDSLRQFNEEVYLSPYEADWKIFIIHEAHRMLTYSANALLKTFEEPGPKSVIILLSSAPQAILPTILSRCQQFRFRPVAKLDSSKKHDPIRERVIQVLSSGKMSYLQLLEAVGDITSKLDDNRKHLEEITRTTLLKTYPEDLTSIQKQAFEKEVEGVLAMNNISSSYTILETILEWYRDMHLLRVNGNPNYLFHQDATKSFEATCQRGEFLPIEAVQKAIAQAKLALERSTPFNQCLENLLCTLRS